MVIHEDIMSWLVGHFSGTGSALTTCHSEQATNLGIHVQLWACATFTLILVTLLARTKATH